MKVQSASAVIMHHKEGCVKTHGVALQLLRRFSVDCHHRVERARYNLLCALALHMTSQSRNKLISNEETPKYLRNIVDNDVRKCAMLLRTFTRNHSWFSNVSLA